jgi:hypothetical protein
MKIIYQKHPVTAEQKAQLRAQGYKIIDEAFAPADYVHPESDKGEQEQCIDPAIQPPYATELPVNDGLDELNTEQLHALAKERGVKVHHNAGADKVREALREAADASEG